MIDTKNLNTDKDIEVKDLKRMPTGQATESTPNPFSGMREVGPRIYVE